MDAINILVWLLPAMTLITLFMSLDIYAIYRICSSRKIFYFELKPAIQVVAWAFSTIGVSLIWIAFFVASIEYLKWVGLFFCFIGLGLIVCGGLLSLRQNGIIVLPTNNPKSYRMKLGTYVAQKAAQLDLQLRINDYSYTSMVLIQTAGDARKKLVELFETEKSD
jgi:hypothetical protein